MTEYRVFSVNGQQVLLIEKPVEATSAEGAIRKHIAKTRAEGGTFVAVPSRSWKPTVVTVETQTVIRIGGAS
jgi:hypothetical protein